MIQISEETIIFFLRRHNRNNNLGLNLYSDKPELHAALQSVMGLNCINLLSPRMCELIIINALSTIARHIRNAYSDEKIEAILKSFYNRKRAEIYGDDLRRMSGDELRDKIGIDVQKVIVIFKNLVAVAKSLPPEARQVRIRMVRQRQALAPEQVAERARLLEEERKQREEARRRKAEERALQREKEKKEKDVDRLRAKEFGLLSAEALKIARENEPAAVAANITVPFCPNPECRKMPIPILLFSGSRVRLCKVCNAELIQKVNPNVLKAYVKRRSLDE